MRHPRAPGNIPLVVAALGLSLTAACAGPAPRSANPTRPLDERRAVQIIARTFEGENLMPVAGEPLQLTEDKTLDVDVSAEARRYGVAYVTGQERLTLGPALSPPNPSMGDALQLVTGYEDQSARILVLHDTNYSYDDHIGAEREASTITAERKLARDVRDFLVRARVENWP